MKGKWNQANCTNIYILTSILMVACIVLHSEADIDPSPSSQLFQTSAPHLMAHPRADLWWWLTRSCPGHKLLFRQPYLLWGVKGEPWITLKGPTLSKHLLLSDDKSTKGVRFQELAWAVLHCLSYGGTENVIIMGDWRVIHNRAKYWFLETSDSTKAMFECKFVAKKKRVKPKVHLYLIYHNIQYFSMSENTVLIFDTEGEKKIPQVFFNKFFLKKQKNSKLPQLWLKLGHVGSFWPMIQCQILSSGYYKVAT